MPYSQRTNIGELAHCTCFGCFARVRASRAEKSLGLRSHYPLLLVEKGEGGKLRGPGEGGAPSGVRRRPPDPFWYRPGGRRESAINRTFLFALPLVCSIILCMCACTPARRHLVIVVVCTRNGLHSKRAGAEAQRLASARGRTCAPHYARRTIGRRRDTPTDAAWRDRGPAGRHHWQCGERVNDTVAHLRRGRGSAQGHRLCRGGPSHADAD